MSEREQPRIPPEAVAKISLTPRQESRVRSFKHIVKRTMEFQEKINLGEEWYFYVYNEQGAKIEKIEITQRTVDAMRTAAVNQYGSFHKVDILADAVKDDVSRLTYRKSSNTPIIDPNKLWLTDADDQI